jgi:hypothetical protein
VIGDREVPEMILKHYRFRGLALAVVIAALLAPAASARAIDQVSPQTQPAQQRQQVSTPPTLPQPAQYSSFSKLPHGAQYSSFQPSTPPSEVQVARVAPNPGFDWGDAGIGAGAGVALTMIGLGGLLVLSSRRNRGEQPAPTA